MKSSHHSTAETDSQSSASSAGSSEGRWGSPAPLNPQVLARDHRPHFPHLSLPFAQNSQIRKLCSVLRTSVTVRS